MYNINDNSLSDIVCPWNLDEIKSEENDYQEIHPSMIEVCIKTEDSEKFDNTKPISLCNLNNRYDLDGDVSWNTARLINHSCSNNCEYEGSGLKLWVSAIKDIKRGEEITCDYGFGYDSDYKQFPCKCKSKNCCGYIVRTESRWRINKKFRKNFIISR